MSIEEPFNLHGWVIDRGECGLHVDGLALNQTLLVSKSTTKVGLFKHGSLFLHLVGCLLLQSGDLSHGFRMLSFHNEVTLGYKNEQREKYLV